MTQHTTRNCQRAAGLEDLFTFLDSSGNSIPGTNTPSHPPTPVNMSSQPESAHIETLDETPNKMLGTTNNEAKAFAKAIDKIVKANYSSSKSKPKLREPNPFDGSNSQKLCTFILQCKLNFRDRPDQFQDDTTKVNYILSHLKGSTLDCFEPALLDPIEPIWLSDLNLFIEELETNFGTYDPVSEAEAELEGLRMHESHQATNCFIKFQQLAARVQWGEAALCSQAYNGLAKCIKDDMVHHEKPNTLSSLQKLIQAIDTQYWERCGEVSHETHASGTSRNKTEQKSDSSKSDNKSGKGLSHSKQKNNNSGSTQGKGSTSEQKKPTTPDLSSKLGKDGKLTPQERQRRPDNKLCLFCGTSGHVAKDCPKSTLASSKARASKTDQEKSVSTNSNSKKRLSSPQDSAQPEDCVKLPRVKTITLNTSALSNPDSLTLSLTSKTLPNMVLKSLVDSGSSDSFIDSVFVQTQHLPAYGIPPIKLRLIDGTSNSVILQALDLQIRFPTGESQNLTFYVTPLDQSCTIVLGYRWLTRYNPSIDWVLGSIFFRQPSQHESKSSPSVETLPSLTPLLNPPDSVPEPPEPFPLVTPWKPPRVTLINAAAYSHASKLEGSDCFQLRISFPEVTGHSTTTFETKVNMSTIPKDYHDFTDIFSKSKAGKLADHRPYDLKITLDEGTSLPFGPIYSFSQEELAALHKFIDENLATGFIHPSRSSHGALVLFIQKKDGSLRLCVDFQGLNQISRKDRYPLPLISDLLYAPRKARIYTKINLQHAYHLIQVAPGDEWKTAFQTHYGSFKWLVMPEGLTNAPAAFQ